MKLLFFIMFPSVFVYPMYMYKMFKVSHNINMNYSYFHSHFTLSLLHSIPHNSHVHFSLVVFRHPSKLLPSIKLKIIKYKKQIKVQCIVYDKTTHLRISINNCKLVLLELRKEKWIFSSMISLSLMLYIGI